MNVYNVRLKKKKKDNKNFMNPSKSTPGMQTSLGAARSEDSEDGTHSRKAGLPGKSVFLMSPRIARSDVNHKTECLKGRE